MDKEAEHLAAMEDSQCGVPLPSHTPASLLKPLYIASMNRRIHPVPLESGESKGNPPWAPVARMRTRIREWALL